MADSKDDKSQKNAEEPITDIPESSSASSGFGNFGVASSWFNQGSSWGTSFFNSAKEKTMTTLDLVKKDLNDLSEAVSAEVTDLALAAKDGFGTAANAVKQQAQMLEKLVTPVDEEKPLPADDVAGECSKEEKKESGLNFGWMSKIVDSVTDTVKNLGMEETTAGEENFTETIRPRQIRKTRLPQIRLNEIQTSEATFTEEAEQSQFYERWMSRFNIDEYDGEINIILKNNPQFRQLFGTLVPAKVDYATFWRRYFYAVDVAELEEEMNGKTLSDALNIEVSTKRGKKGEIDSKKSSPSSEGSAVVVEEPTSPSQSEWSVCSEKNVEEIPSNDEDESNGPMTPKPVDGEKKTNEEGWVDWEE